MKLYFHPISPPARAVIVTAKHLNVDIELEEVDLFAGGTRTEAYMKMNPSHTVPTLIDDGQALFESRALMQYIANKYRANNAIYPADAKSRAVVDMVLYFDASSFTPALRAVFLPRLLEKKACPESALMEMREKIDILDKLLGESLFFGGANLSLADISIATQFPLLKICAPGLISPRIQSWFERTLRDCPELEKSNDTFDYESALKVEN